MVDNQPYYFDPMTAPKELLDWMAMWVDLDEGDDWALPKKRALVAAAPVLYRMRGTKAGIKKHLGIYAGAGGLTLVNERTNGFRLDSDSRLGVNTSIGEEREHVFTVTVAVHDPDELDMDTLRGIIDADKPVETAYILRMVKMG
jgi:phage tail-like protein